MKTKLGISVGLLGAMLYFAAYFGGYIPAILLAGYVLMFEESEYLKKTAVKAVALLVCINVLLALIGLLPDLLSWLRGIVVLFNGEFSYTVITRIVNIITSTIGIIRTCLFLLSGIKALNQGSVAVPFVDKLIDKYM